VKSNSDYYHPYWSGWKGLAIALAIDDAGGLLAAAADAPFAGSIFMGRKGAKPRRLKVLELALRSRPTLVREGKESAEARETLECSLDPDPKEATSATGWCKPVL
jgi:hypothetical protein